jgi:hypothetical protein
MPYNLNPANPTAVIDPVLSTSFVLTRIYPLLTIEYNDGTIERSLVQDGVNPPRAMRTWVLSHRLNTWQFSQLLKMWRVIAHGGQEPFFFYDPTDVLPGQKHGSNYDPTGGNAQGRATVFFRGNWSHTVGPGRNVVPNITLIEVA